MSSARRDPLVGTTVEDRYEVLERVARGGMSTVYRALDHRLDRMVALKVMHPHLAEDPALVARFEREAKTAARISHPHVVAVLDQGHTVDASGETVAYLVMEFVAGRTLRSVIRAEAPLTPRRALDLLQPTLAGLAAAHRAGLVHRDVKPENILVREDGRVTVADFGLSRAATGHTSTGQAVLGTPAYLAPEHIAGEHADTRADVYAAGILLFELLTGRQPFTAAGPLQVAYRHLHERVPVPSTLVPGLAESLDDLVLWCTEPDPRDRPQDAVVLLGELERVRAGLSDAELDHVPPAAAGGSAGHGRPAEDEADDDGADPDGADIDIEERPDSETLPVPRRAADGPRDGALPPDDDATRTLPVAVVSDGRGSGTPAPRRAAAPPSAGASPLAADGPTDARPVSARARRRSAREPIERLGSGGGRTVAIGAAVTLLLTGVALLLGFTLGSGGLGGPAGTVVPPLTGLDQDDARARLAQAGLAAEVTARHDERRSDGVVLATEPAAGTAVDGRTAVSVTVSAGPSPVKVPDLTGLTVTAAHRAADEAGLRVRVDERRADGRVPAGSVTGQGAAPGTALRPGSAVPVVVSTGAAAHAVPPVVGLTAAQARTRLEDAGLTVHVDGPGHGAARVTAQGTPAGTLLPEGAHVRIAVD